MTTLAEFIGGLTFDFPAIAIAVATIFILIVIVQWHVDDTQFDLRRVLIDRETGHVSLHKLGQFVALVVSTLALWYEMMHARLTEWLFAGYMLAWTGANLAARWIDSNKAPHALHAPDPGSTPPAPPPQDDDDRVFEAEPAKMPEKPPLRVAPRKRSN